MATAVREEIMAAGPPVMRLQSSTTLTGFFSVMKAKPQAPLPVMPQMIQLVYL